jgi:hypothetical protein
MAAPSARAVGTRHMAHRHKPATGRPLNRNVRIMFCEPYTWQPGDRTGVAFQVSGKFYPVLLRKPASYHRRRYAAGVFEVGNAYRFGPRYPFGAYKYLGEHSNDGAQTGLIDLDHLDAKAQKSMASLVLDAYSKGPRARQLDWDDRAALRRLRAKVPHVLFLGATDGGDVGASLYVHRTRGRVDGLVIDNNFFARQN